MMDLLWVGVGALGIWVGIKACNSELKGTFSEQFELLRLPN